MTDLTPQGNKDLSYGASGSDAPLASSPDRGTLELREASRAEREEINKAALDRALAAKAITLLERDVLLADLGGKYQTTADLAAYLESTPSSVRAARSKGNKKLIDFLAS